MAEWHPEWQNSRHGLNSVIALNVRGWVTVS